MIRVFKLTRMWSTQNSSFLHTPDLFSTSLDSNTDFILFLVCFWNPFKKTFCPLNISCEYKEEKNIFNWNSLLNSEAKVNWDFTLN